MNEPTDNKKNENLSNIKLARRLAAIVDEEKIYPNRASFRDAIEHWVNEHLHQFDGQTFTMNYQKWNRILKQPNEMAYTIEPLQYQMINAYLKAKELDYAKHKDSVAIANIENYMFFALKNFLGVGEHTVENFMARLPGTYWIYMKSASMPDRYFLGMAVMARVSGALTVHIKLTNRNRPEEGQDPRVRFREIVYEFEGVAVYRSGNVFIVARHKSGNTLHTIYLDDRNLREEGGVAILKGSFTGALDDGCHSRKVMFERIEPKSFKEPLEEYLDMLRAEQVPTIVRNYLDNPEAY